MVALLHIICSPLIQAHSSSTEKVLCQCNLPEDAVSASVAKLKQKNICIGKLVVEAWRRKLLILFSVEHWVQGVVWPWMTPETNLALRSQPVLQVQYWWLKLIPLKLIPLNVMPWNSGSVIWFIMLTWVTRIFVTGNWNKSIALSFKYSLEWALWEKKCSDGI